ncbi:hypothetical protein E8E13_004452 [Curvularia kusanoi]|uniref:Uncharacterized protein n=1 Tax=Curvularia kusanoi TaxID=90978 RepID=A0A9P4W9D7_CURKU|nr:hypothetical protein E8E13_004452 [Curvularia kusanoi]
MSAPLPSGSEDSGTNTRPAMAAEAQVLSDERVMDIVMPMTPEERFEYMRRQVTAFSAENRATPAPSPRESHLINREEDTSADQSIQDFLFGIGAGLSSGRQMIVRYSDPSLSTVSLQISETRTSEADTVVDGQVFTSTNFLREVFGRGYRLSVEISGQQDRRDGVDRVDEHNRN